MRVTHEWCSTATCSAVVIRHCCCCGCCCGGGGCCCCHAAWSCFSDGGTLYRLRALTGAIRARICCCDYVQYVCGPCGLQCVM